MKYFDKIAEMRDNMHKHAMKDSSGPSFFGRVKRINGLTTTIDSPAGEIKVVTSPGSRPGGTRIKAHTAQGDVDIPF